MNSVRTAHFIGIAGAGMGPTAKLLRDSGVKVSGSDADIYPPMSDFLREQNIPCRTPYAPENIPADVDLIVIGKNARLVRETNAEVAAAYASGAEICSFAEVLGRYSGGKENIVVAGSYGKSSSTALLAHCLEHAAGALGAHCDPGYIIGAIPLTPSISARWGRSNLFILEGDEYPSSNTDRRAKFLHYHPAHLLITPLAHDHVNVFPTPRDYVAPFHDLMALPPAGATVMVCLEGPLSGDFLAGISRPVVTYGVHRGDFHATDIRYGETTRFRIVGDGAPDIEIETTQLGEHSVQNIVGVAAFLLSRGLVPADCLAAAIAGFRGIKRRLDRKSERTSVPIFEGFGSSYDKARSAIAAMKLHFPQRRLVVVFEPHTFSWRNRAALSWYDDVFQGSGKVFIFEPAAQGAATHDQVSQGEIVARVRSAGYDAEAISDPGQAVQAIRKVLTADDAILLLSSGNLGGLIELVPAMAEQVFPLPPRPARAAAAMT